MLLERFEAVLDSVARHGHIIEFLAECVDSFTKRAHGLGRRLRVEHGLLLHGFPKVFRNRQETVVATLHSNARTERRPTRQHHLVLRVTQLAAETGVLPL